MRRQFRRALRASRHFVLSLYAWAITFFGRAPVDGDQPLAAQSSVPAEPDVSAPHESDALTPGSDVLMKKLTAVWREVTVQPTRVFTNGARYFGLGDYVECYREEFRDLPKTESMRTARRRRLERVRRERD